jgi:divalent metal cation (Fe/Co/Zn/Cd) transporter
VICLGLCSIIATLCIILRCYLIKEGATGGFNIGFDLKGMMAYFASLAPGLLFLISGVVIIWAGVRRKFRFVIPWHDGDMKVEAGGKQ